MAASQRERRTLPRSHRCAPGELRTRRLNCRHAQLPYAWTHVGIRWAPNSNANLSDAVITLFVEGAQYGQAQLVTGPLLALNASGWSVAVGKACADCSGESWGYFWGAWPLAARAEACGR
jgi:hypothetical protein